MIEIDVPQLRKELEYITAHRGQWKQNAWLETGACGTVGCLAGNTALNAGYLPVRGHTSFVSRERVLPNEHGLFGLIENDDGTTTTGDGVLVESVRDVAARVLSLTYTQSAALFNGRNSLYDLWRLASLFTGGEIEVPPEVVREHEQRTSVPDGRTTMARNEDARYVLSLQRGAVRERKLPTRA